MKKNKRLSTPEKKPTEHAPLLTKKSLQWIGGGIGLLVIGYSVLSFADAKAQNLPGLLSPFLILGGYAAIGVGLFLNKKND